MKLSDFTYDKNHSLTLLHIYILYIRYIFINVKSGRYNPNLSSICPILRKKNNQPFIRFRITDLQQRSAFDRLVCTAPQWLHSHSLHPCEWQELLRGKTVYMFCIKQCPGHTKYCILIEILIGKETILATYLLYCLSIRPLLVIRLTVYATLLKSTQELVLLCHYGHALNYILPYLQVLYRLVHQPVLLVHYITIFQTSY